jgi:hypothetical protein
MGAVSTLSLANETVSDYKPKTTERPPALHTKHRVSLYSDPTEVRVEYGATMTLPPSALDTRTCAS